MNDLDKRAAAWAFRAFALAHPLEAYRQDPEQFWEVFKTKRPNCNREHMIVVLEKIGLNKA